MMAFRDYKICDLCGEAKVFYDANIDDERYLATTGYESKLDPIGLKAICGNCNKTHEVVVVPRSMEESMTDDLISREAALAAVMHMSDAYERIYVLPAAQVKVKPLVWEDLGFIYRAYDPASGIGFYAETKVEIDDIENSRQLRILAALDLSPKAVDASQMPDPVVNEHDDPVCTCCGGTGITFQTERRCACQTPDPVLSDPRVKALLELLREANDDLKAYVDADWPEDQRARYPSYQRKWERDMELCNRIDAALRAIGGEA